MIKKIIAALLTLATLFCLCSCGKEAKKEDTASKKKTPVEKEIVWKDNPKVDTMDIDSIPAMRELDYYEEKIVAFESKPIEEGKIVFYGSSGFTRWSTEWGNTPLEAAVTSSTGERVCLNRGFGGSTMHELCHYYDRVIKPLKPKALVITSFLNDASYYSNDQMMQFVQWICNRARTDMPGIKIYITDWRPTAKSCSYSDIERRHKMNKTLLAYAKVHDDVEIIELSKARMFYIDDESAEKGTYTDINKAIFIEDQVHYTPEGYKRYAEVFKEALKDVLG